MSLQHLLVEKLVTEKLSINKNLIDEISHIGQNIFIVKITNLIEEITYDAGCVVFKVIKN